MEIQKLLTLYARHPQVRAMARALKNEKERTLQVAGLQASAAPLALAAVATLAGTSQADEAPAAGAPPFLFVLDDAEEAGYFYHDLVQLLGEARVLFFPSSFRRAVKFGQRDAASEILRTEVLSRMTDASAGQSSLIVVTYPEALAEKVISKKALDEQTLQVRVGEEVDIAFVEETLLTFGFQRTDYVYEPGQFAVRGSLVDVFSYSSEYPYRIDFFDKEVDSIRSFEVDTQLSRGKHELVSLVPELGRQHEDCVSLAKLLPGRTLLLCKDITYVVERIGQIWEEGFSQQALLEERSKPSAIALRQGGQAPSDDETVQRLDRDLMLMDAHAFERDFAPFRRVEWNSHATRLSEKGRGAVPAFDIIPQPIFHKNFDLLTKAFEDYHAKGYTLYILADSPKQIDRLNAIFEANQDSAQPREGGLLFIPVSKTLHAGFVDHTLKVCLFTDHQIFDRFHKYNLRSDRARGGKVALSLKELQEFEVGDYVVHVDHGIGRFGGLIRVPQADGRLQEMIKITYDHDDVVYVSIHALHKVSKYKGKEGEPPRISRLGTGAWERMKERTKAKIKDIARDLIQLYSRRREEKGFRFSPDSYMQHELEASFLYEDTPDQLKATQEVKADMERPIPMDRLVCGDVGFGKTEVAVRAAFKAAVDGKQTAVLVPTTVLAYQHFRTFASRLKDMPVRVDYLSRARSAKQVNALLHDLEEGKIDILIGTHKLIGKTVKFKDLGLLVIDEEQKFGVSTKEKLRQMKTNVDTLTMSATPIPRTLQFSLVGARDLSVIHTPPPNRYPIQTEIHVFSPEIITDAINFEMSRNGQVFFVNNRISDLTHIAEMIKKYIPDCRIAIGHGQMKSDELEKTVLDFSDYEYDVLLSTTIVENGIDIPNANTIIINSAQNFGLSDLHQMRGRVGRGNRKAFCYLLAPPLSALPQDSRRRLEALENFSDLGSGINIAMQDLDIRGAGNLLGAEQSGFISDLGYETYQKILNEAMTELRNEEKASPSPSRGGDVRLDKSPTDSSSGKQTSPPPEGLGEAYGGFGWVSDCTLESDLEMYFPDQYVPSDSERMLLYRELDNQKDDNDLEAYRQRMLDRFGPLPPVAEELLQVVPLRRLGQQLGCEKIMLKQGRMFLYFVSNTSSPFYQSSTFGRIINYATQNVRRCQMRNQNGKPSMVIDSVPTVEEAVNVLKAI